MGKQASRLAAICSLLLLAAAGQSLRADSIRFTTVTVNFSQTGFAPYGGTVSGWFSAVLDEGDLLYNVADDIGVLLDSRATFTGNFPDHPNVTLDLGPAQRLQWSPNVFVLDFGSYLAADPEYGSLPVDFEPGPGNVIAFGTHQISFDPIQITVTAIPEPGSLNLLLLAAVLGTACIGCAALSARIRTLPRSFIKRKRVVALP